mmetsp:Transcript_34208/g.66235  ORF Transcript_34208/g.66235 Transcript_34208/m.66235 type:complete len:135 (+) Transcript_34208:273-677(+)
MKTSKSTGSNWKRMRQRQRQLEIIKRVMLTVAGNKMAGIRHGKKVLGMQQNQTHGMMELESLTQAGMRKKNRQQQQKQQQQQQKQQNRQQHAFVLNIVAPSPDYYFKQSSSAVAQGSVNFGLLSAPFFAHKSNN